MTETRKLKVFLCHASQDKSIVSELYQRLLAEGWIDPWLDEEKLLPGQVWDSEIEKAVEATAAVIVFLPNNSVSKEGYVQKEIKKILDVADEKPDGEIFIILLRLDDCQIPNRFPHWQHKDNFPKEKQGKTFQRLAKSLKLRAASFGIDTPFSELDADGNDNLLPQAILLVKRFDGISVYRLQRYLRIGYTRASNLIEKLIELGIIFEKMVGIISARQNKSPLFIKNRMPS